MGIVFVPFEVEVEQRLRERLGEGPLPQGVVARLGTLLDEAAEFDASMAVAVVLSRLGSFPEQLLKNILGQPASCQATTCKAHE
jgi:hypothetical protein